MNPIRTVNTNMQLGAPNNWNYAKGDCVPLPVQKTDTSIISFWQPTVAERAAIAAGKPVRLTVYGQTHPPVILDVE